MSLNIQKNGFSIQELLNNSDSPNEWIFSGDWLDLSRLNIISLDGLENIPNITRVKDLNLSGNNLTTLVNNTFKNLNHLEWLDLSRNQIANIEPEAFNGLSELKSLYISENQLTILPEKVFCHLTNLQRLGLGENILTTIGEQDFGDLSRLQELNLKNNKLTTIPPDIFRNLGQLQALYLQNNNLTTIAPQTFEDLVNLEEINISGNPLSSPDQKKFRGLPKLIDHVTGTSPMTLTRDKENDEDELDDSAEKLTLSSPYCNLTEEQIKEIFENSIDEAYMFIVKPSDAMQSLTIESKFGGKPYNEGEPWPICSGCHDPLCFIFQFNNDNLPSRKKIEKNVLFVLFMCYKDGGCWPFNDGTWLVRRYLSPSLEKAQNVIHLPDDEDDHFSIIPCTIDLSYRKVLPDLEQIGTTEKTVLDLIAQKDDDIDLLYAKIAKTLIKCPIDHVGGSKYLGVIDTFNFLKLPLCSVCNKTMDLLFQVGDMDEPNFCYGDAGYIYVFYCQDHQEVIKFEAQG